MAAIQPESRFKRSSAPKSTQDKSQQRSQRGVHRPSRWSGLVWGFLLVLLLILSSCTSSSNDLSITDVQVNLNRPASAEMPYDEYQLLVTIKNSGSELNSNEVYFSAGKSQYSYKLANHGERLILGDGDEFSFNYLLLAKNSNQSEFDLKIDSGNSAESNANGLISESDETNNNFKIKIL